MMGEQRRYTIDEIDEMRVAIESLKMVAHAWNAEGKPIAWSGSRDKEQIERELRTHLLNGTDPKDLMDRAGKHMGY